MGVDCGPSVGDLRLNYVYYSISRRKVDTGSRDDRTFECFSHKPDIPFLPEDHRGGLFVTRRRQQQTTTTPSLVCHIATATNFNSIKAKANRRDVVVRTHRYVMFSTARR
ncbi:hypothetical protein Bbelb_407220 [Branchiostoma belcheri]|nr:hypothetical protein Bbelb_407220 [Branchiostoma belcheri]